MTRPTDRLLTASQAAAVWWADAIKAPRFDNGDAFMSMLGTLAASYSATPTEAQRGGFAEILQAKIEEQFTRMAGWRDDDPYLTVGVDYGPDRMLREAAVEAGIGGRAFPWKTNMWIRVDHVVVSAGYRGRDQLVWASDEWLADRPVCGSQKWDESIRSEGYHGDPWSCSLPKYHDESHQFDAPLALCARCGHVDGYWHDPAEREWRPDFHEFEAQ